MTTIESTLRSIIVDVLGVSQSRADALDDNSGLFGTLPELDSMAVANLLTEIEDRLGIIIDDDEIDGDLLERFGSLRSFLETKAGT